MFDRITATTLLAAVALAASPALGQFAFEPTVSVPAGPQPGGAAVGDLDGDGDLDLATGIQFPDRVLIMTNDGTGSFAAAVTISYPNGSQPEEVVAGDLDGDGDVDLAIILRGLLQVRIALNQGGLVFTQGGSPSIGANGRGMAMKDMDGDGDLDIAVANRDSNTASVLTNDGMANFTTQTLPSAGEPRAASFGDLDGDGDLDLAVTNNDAFNVRLFRNTAGTFAAWQVLSTAPNQAEGVTIADLDNDGDMDIATGAEDDNVGVNNAVIFVNAGAGSFGGAVPFPTSGIGTSGVVAIDLDCDGLLDLALSNQDSNDISLLRNLGGGVFGPATLRPCGTNPEALGSGDLDGDFLEDLVTGNRDSGNMSVLLNRTCSPVDVDQNGVVDVEDLVIVILNWGACDGCPADIDNDGMVGVTDFVAVILNWS